MTIKNAPALPLPWVANLESPGWNPITSARDPVPILGPLRVTTNEDGIHFDPKDIAYAVHTANAYPRLVKALRDAIRVGLRSDNMVDEIAVLRDLGEEPK